MNQRKTRRMGRSVERTRPLSPGRSGRTPRAIRSSVPAASRAPGLRTLIGATVGALTFFGLLMVMSASAVPSLEKSGTAFFIFWRQLIMAVLGGVCFAFFAKRDYHVLEKWSRPLVALSFLLLLLVLIPGVGASAGGASRWIGWGPIGFQPSELAKFATLVYVAFVLSRPGCEPVATRDFLVPTLPVVGVLSALIMLQPDLGTTISLGICLLVVLWVAGIPKMAMGGLLGSAVLATLALSLTEDYRRRRLLAFFNPWSDAGDAGYHSVQSLIAIGSGGWTGLGLGAGRQKWLFLPNAHTDFVFAVIGEELGFVGCIAVILLFVALAVFGFKVAANAPDAFGRYLAAGITGWISVQAAINIGVTIGGLPVTGIPLPFVSAGGSALVVGLAATGVLVNIARAAERQA